MNKILSIATLAGMMLLPSCKEDIETPGNIASENDEVVFQYADANSSRTTYEDDWDTSNSTQEVYWGNYLAQQPEDEIKVYCYNAARQYGTYRIETQATPSSSAKSITRLGIAGVQWGPSTAVHDFYAFYPASKAGDAFVSGSDRVINAEVTPGQSPVSYSMRIGNGETVKTNALTAAIANTTQSTANTTTIWGMPDMSAAIMVAHTQTAAADYGKPVPLNFKVTADVLDITVNGPVVPNTLGGNGKAEDYIFIRSVTIRSKSGASLTGKFNIDLNSGEVSRITNGSSFIQLNTTITEGGSSRNPHLYVRAATEKPTAGQLDCLRLRAFMIPGQVKNLNDLEIVVSTNRGEYTQPLTDAAITPYAIHRVKMPFFKTPGKEFEFDHWLDQLDPNIFINELSLPGSWHSPSSSQQVSTSSTTRTQNTTMAQQYDAGIRAFEVQTQPSRFRYQYVAYVRDLGNTRLSTVLNEIGAKLKPTEFVVFEVGYIANSPYTAANWVTAIQNELNAVDKLYTGGINRNTTIGDVKGKIIVKINTNDANNETGWKNPTNALFSRWIGGSAITPQTVNLKWGQPVAPTPLDQDVDALKWYFTQGDIIGNGGHSNLEERCTALETFGSEALKFYNNGNHNHWFYCLIGGYNNSNQEYDGKSYSIGALELAKQQNPFMRRVLTNPLRQAGPYGIIMMNFADNTADYGAECESSELIRAIINNNMSFVLNKRTN